MQDYQESYQYWCTQSFFDEDTIRELENIQTDKKEIEDRFYRDLSFGTAGLRGVIGAGTNRMNIYMVAKATAGVASYVRNEGEDAMKKGVVISYDSRHFSEEFARITAGVLTRAGIRVFLSDRLRPVPLLSYAIRYYKAIAGVMITASHNPSKYNGYKLYGEDGAQVTPEIAGAVLTRMQEIKDITTLSWDSISEAQGSGLLTIFGEDLDDAYISMLKELLLAPDAIRREGDMSIVYTPLHGSGNEPVRRILSEIGFTNVHVVSEQEKPDGDFPTVDTPNPENPESLKMGIELAKKVDASLVIGTDPDCDRIGICVRDEEGVFHALSGNQIGILLLDYILSSKKESGSLPADSFAVTTVVSSKLAGRICEEYGVELIEVLTGFKFIGEKILELDENGDRHFQFGFEESCGFLAGKDVRDKDAVVAAMLIAGMAAQSQQDGKTLLHRLEDLYKKVGYGYEESVSIMLEGIDGVEKIASAMADLRKDLQNSSASKALFSGLRVHAVRDYKTGKRVCLEKEEPSVSDLTLPSSDVLLYELGGENGLDWACVRPSGTEPKLKIYFGAYGRDKDTVRARLTVLKDKVEKSVKERL